MKPESRQFEVVLSYIFLILVTGCGPSADSPEVILERAHILADKQKFDDAVELYNKALESFPDRASAIYRRGTCYENAGLLDRALEDYSRTVELDPTHTRAINDKGVTLAKLDRFEEAAREFTTLIELDSEDVLAIRNRGLCYHDLERYDEALADYDLAIKVDKSDAQSWFQRGNVYLQLKKFDQAISDYNKTLELDEIHSRAIVNRGVALFNRGNTKAGLEDLVKAQELDSNIIIPAIDWASIGESAPEPDVVIVAKPVFSDALNDWSAVERFVEDYLSREGFNSIQNVASFPEHFCGTILCKKEGENHRVHFAVQTKSRPMSVPAAEVTNAVEQQSLIVLGENAEGEQKELDILRFVPDWEPPKEAKPLLLSIPDAATTN